ncbi:MAG: FAD-dependent oxidoreductase [Burkholderiales bacterium]
MKRVLLAGAGHAHAWVLAALARSPVHGARITLVSPHARQIYSAMLPGVIAGHYRRSEAEFDVAALAARADVEFVSGEIARFDAERRVATLSDGRSFSYDIASLNAGSRTDTSVPGADELALAVKPFERLLERLRVISRVAVAGGGAAGAELAMALRHRGGAVTLYSEGTPFPPPLAERIERALRRRGVDFRPGMRIDALEPGPVVLAGRSRQEFDLVLWAAGAAPLPWLEKSGLALDEDGFVCVDPGLRSISHPEVFAVGDCAALAEAKSGVHAVRHGRLLEQNLRNVLLGWPVRPYEPEAKALLLLTCGSRYAIASRGDWTAEGRSLWWWKNWIDRRWLGFLAGKKNAPSGRTAPLSEKRR